MELRFKNVSKKYGEVFAVDNVSYSMETGVYGLLGVNGAGKTTLMTMLCTVTRPTAGEITWDGNDIFGLGERYRDLLGYLPQDFGFYPDISVSDYMMYIASIKGIRPAVAKKRMKELLEMVGLSKYKERKMKVLSGGMARRVGIAQAMLNDPKILVLDEPTAGLDPSERIRFRNLISRLAKDRLVLLSTHIVSDVEFIAEQIILMKDGKFFFTGTSGELTSGMEEDVWSCTVPGEKVNQYMQEYSVGNVKYASGGVELRILSKTPPSENAVREEPTLEDAFLLYFGEKAGGEDAEV